MIIESVVPDDDREHLSTLLSLELLVAASGKERTEAEYAGLLSRAGFRHTRTVHTVGTVAVVEAKSTDRSHRANTPWACLTHGVFD